MMDFTTSITLILVAAIGAIPSLVNGRKMTRINEKVDEYHKDVNGKVAQLIDATKAGNIAEGRAAGIEHERKRRK